MAQQQHEMSIAYIPVFSLDLAGVFEDPDVNEQVPRWFQTSSQINISPLSFVSSQQIPVLPDIILFLRTQATGSTVCRASASPERVASGNSITYLLAGEVHDVCATPDQLFQFVRPGPVVGKQTALVSSHGQMVRQKRPGHALVGIWIE